MLANVLIGIFLVAIGAIGMTYNVAQGSAEGFGQYWPWALMAAVVMIAGLILLYAAFRPVEM